MDGTTDEILLASDEASYVTGCIVTADGGWSTNSMPHSLKHLMDAQEFPDRPHE